MKVEKRLSSDKGECALSLDGAADSAAVLEQGFPLRACIRGGRAVEFVAAAAIVLLAFFAVFSFVGCAEEGDSGEAAIRASLTGELEAVKSLDASFADEVLAGMDDAGFDQYGISPEEFLSEYFEGFDYSIDAIEIDGDEAWATVTIRCKSFESFCSLVDYESKRALGNMDASALGEEELNGLVGEVVLSSLGQVEVSACDPVTFEYELVDGKWVQGAAYASVLADALASN